MTDDLVKQALAELGDVVRCRCHEAYRDRDLQDPQCQCDSMDAVRVVIARIEQLEQEAILDAKLLADTQALLDTALEAVIDAKLVAEAKLAEVEAERDYTDGTNEVLRGENQRLEATVATLTAQVEALRGALTPSADTKADYIGEFSFPYCTGFDDYGHDIVTEISVPWTTIKEIMAAILACATLTTEKTND